MTTFTQLDHVSIENKQHFHRVSSAVIHQTKLSFSFIPPLPRPKTRTYPTTTSPKVIRLFSFLCKGPMTDKNMHMILSCYQYVKRSLSLCTLLRRIQYCMTIQINTNKQMKLLFYIKVSNSQCGPILNTI